MQKLPEKIVCVTCGRPVSIKEFYLNYNEIHKQYNYGRMYHCKSCTKTISQDIMGRYWDINKNKDDKIAYSLGIRAICSFFHMPYLNDAMVMVRDTDITSTKERDRNYVFQYMDALEQLEIPKEYWNDLSGNSFLSIDLLKIAKPTSDGDMDLFNQLEKDWGVQDTLEDYLFLEEEFKKYTEGETLNATMVNMLRYLCEAQLDVNKLKKDKAKLEDIAKAEKRVTDYYSKLKLDDFKFNKSKSAEEKLIEQWANITESQEPIDWEDDNLKDRMGFEEDYDDIMRAMGNKLVGTKDYPTITYEDVKRKEEQKYKSKKGRKKK